MTAEAMDVVGVVNKEKTKDDMEQEDMGGKAANPEFSKFMQGFWDLASVDVPVRACAAAMIARYVGNTAADGDSSYAVKRLVRGVCSSRNAARQGFASCLAEVLKILPADSPTTAAVLEQILEGTKTTIAMKGAEERELVLGRLVGVSALALSGRLGSDSESAEGALKAVAELYERRKWLGQAAGEGCLLVASKAFEGEGGFTRVALPCLLPLLRGKDGSTLQISDLTPDQLMLSFGLRAMMRARGLDPQEDTGLKQALPPFLRHATIVRTGKAQDLLPVLTKSTSVFPKVHSVWGHLWDDIGLARAGEPRTSLSSKRLKRLGEVWATVVDGALTTTSLSNKGTSVLLLKQVLHRVPAAGVWHVLSPGIVRLFLNHTHREDNYLYSLVKMTLQQLPSLVQDDQEVQGQLAACLLRRGTIRFDSRTRVNVVSSLVSSMGQEALYKHVEFLKGTIQGKPGWGGSEGTVSNGTTSTDKADAESPGDPVTPAGEAGENAEDFAAERLQAVETLHSLGRGGDGSHIQGERLTKTAEFFLETGFYTPVAGASPLPPKILDLCRSKFFSLVADIAAKPWLTWSAQGHKQPQDNQEATKWEALEALWGLHETWQALEAGGRELVKGLSVGSDEREACAAALAAAGRIRDGEGSKLAYGFAGNLLMVSLHIMDGSREQGRGEERCQHIFDIVETYGRMSGTGKEGNEEDDEDSDDAEDPDPLAMLADVLIAVVAEPSSHSVRGLRDAARRLWGIVCQKCSITKSALDTLLAAVCGEDNEDEDDDDDFSSSEEEDDDDDGDEDMIDRERKATGDSPSGQAAAADDSGGDSDSEDDEDEVVVDPSDIAALLGGSDDDEDGEGLQHHAGADQALAGLIGLKKSGRKKGAQEAQRQAYQIRLRALDLLEALCGRSLHSQHLIGALVRVLNAIKKLGGSSGLGNRNGGEALALKQRLETLYKRLCKCKPQVATEASGTSGTMHEDLATQTAQVFSQLMTLCRSWKKDPPLASLALEGGLCCLRSLKGRSIGDKMGQGNGMVDDDGGIEEAALDGALEALAAAIGEFFTNKRGGGLTPPQVEEVVKRFPEEMVPVLVSAATGKVASEFLRTEAFRLISAVFQRRGQLNQTSRKAIVANCPAILQALADVLAKTSAAAAAAAASRSQSDNAVSEDTIEFTNGKIGKSSDSDAKGAKANGKHANSAAFPPMLKAKRMKPLLGCLSVTIKALAESGAGVAGKEALSALSGEASALRVALSEVGEASASLPMQLLCERTAAELDVIDGGAEGDATGYVVDKVSAVEGAAMAVEHMGSVQKTTKKKRRQSSGEGGQGSASKEDTPGDDSSAKKHKKKKRHSDVGIEKDTVEEVVDGTALNGEVDCTKVGSAKKGRGEKAKRRKTVEA